MAFTACGALLVQTGLALTGCGDFLAAPRREARPPPDFSLATGLALTGLALTGCGAFLAAPRREARPPPDFIGTTGWSLTGCGAFLAAPRRDARPPPMPLPPLFGAFPPLSALGCMRAGGASVLNRRERRFWRATVRCDGWLLSLRTWPASRLALLCSPLLGSPRPLPVVLPAQLSLRPRPASRLALRLVLRPSLPSPGAWSPKRKSETSHLAEGVSLPFHTFGQY